MVAESNQVPAVEGSVEEGFYGRGRSNASKFYKGQGPYAHIDYRDSWTWKIDEPSKKISLHYATVVVGAHGPPHHDHDHLDVIVGSKVSPEDEKKYSENPKIKDLLSKGYTLDQGTPTTPAPVAAPAPAVNIDAEAERFAANIARKKGVPVTPQLVAWAKKTLQSKQGISEDMFLEFVNLMPKS